DRRTIGDMFNNYDTGEDDFSDAGGQPSSDSERDKALASDFTSVNEKIKAKFEAAINAVDPATGMQTSLKLTDVSSDGDANMQEGIVTDNRTSSSVAGTSTDSKSGEGDVASDETSSDHLNVVI